MKAVENLIKAASTKEDNKQETEQERNFNDPDYINKLKKTLETGNFTQWINEVLTKDTRTLWTAPDDATAQLLSGMQNVIEQKNLKINPRSEDNFKNLVTGLIIDKAVQNSKYFLFRHNQEAQEKVSAGLHDAWGDLKKKPTKLQDWVDTELKKRGIKHFSRGIEESKENLLKEVEDCLPRKINSRNFKSCIIKTMIKKAVQSLNVDQKNSKEWWSKFTENEQQSMQSDLEKSKKNLTLEEFKQHKYYKDETNKLCDEYKKLPRTPEKWVPWVQTEMKKRREDFNHRLKTKIFESIKKSKYQDDQEWWSKLKEKEQKGT